MLNLELSLGVTTLIQQLYLHFNLEDKVDFKGDGNVMINDVLTSCLFTNILYIEEIDCDIKVVEFKMMERIRHKKMLLSSWSDALEFYHVQIMDTLEVYSMEPLEVDSLMVLESLFTNEVVGLINLCKIDAVMDDKSHTKSFYEDVLVYRSFCFDPGGHLDMYASTRSSQFKQWDRGKICAKYNFYNLEDKVGFKREGIVMNPPN
jgi:hypothetical protein